MFRRIGLHVAAMVISGHVMFHVKGILREARIYL